jgi:hypothetical protein
VTTPTLPAVRKMGHGQLLVGSAGSPMDFSGRCTKASVTWKEDSSDDVEVLSGDVIDGDTTYDATLEATIYQDDLRAGGIIDYSWAHKGEVVPFTFLPFDGARGVTGQLKLSPLDIGGDVGKKNTSDLKWSCVGEPTLVDDLT